MPAPGQFIPRKSSAHRIACISLYRALLKQCPHISLPDDISLRGKIDPIKHFIQKVFRKNVYHTSPKLIVSALEAGYAAHSLLQHAASSPPNSPNPSLLQIHTLLRALSQSYSAARIACPPKPKAPFNRKVAYPGAPKVIDIRPLPKEKLTGRRHIPTLVAVHGIFPFMRFKKPQSAYLSRVLTQKVKSKKNMFERLETMEELGDLSSHEDVWDKEIESIIGRNSRFDRGWGNRRDDRVHGSRLAGTWQQEPNQQRQATWNKIIEEGRNNRKLGDKMVEIINKERKLWEEERRERKHLKNQQKWAKKLGKPLTAETARASSSPLPSNVKRNL